MPDTERVVITGIGLTSPLGNSMADLRTGVLKCKAKVSKIETRFMGQVLAGVCSFDEYKHQSKKERRRGTRAGSIAVFCSQEAVASANLDLATLNRSRVGTYVGITEHGTVETENEIDVIRQFDYDTKYWSHHHNPRTVANNPAGEVTLSLGLTGPHYTIGAACAAGNAGLIQASQMLRLGEVDVAFGGGVSEAIHSFGIFASFASQGALAWDDDPNCASRPFDVGRKGIVVAEGGCLFVVERLADAKRRGAPIIAEIAGSFMNSDAADPVVPSSEGLSRCMNGAMGSAGVAPDDINIVSTHATATELGDIQEANALRQVFGDCPDVYINNTKSYFGHAMGAAGALELAGNLGAFEDGYVHPTINITEVDPRCEVRNLVVNQPKEIGRVDHILNNSFGMLGINSAVVIRRPSRR